MRFVLFSPCSLVISLSLFECTVEHTSSRYWLAGSYEERFQKGLEPENVDKEFLRLWFKENCNPYEDEVLPAAPAEFVTQIAWRYIFLYETITGSRTDILPTQEPIHDRNSRNTSQALSSLRQL